ncbi:hypothetical protein SAMN05421872_101574 [Nocardioides lianchengensis]|uniref:Uncharacterized protein n=1 Tax=Nocardioides lianchengensis TaxID=1045774 RepID=A0A1G6JT24_9ACTN|nr:hypothetical protein SAMN05421872_101574 [Nocardioides lianchengensis]
MGGLCRGDSTGTGDVSLTGGSESRCRIPWLGVYSVGIVLDDLTIYHGGIPVVVNCDVDFNVRFRVRSSGRLDGRDLLKARQAEVLTVDAESDPDS